MLRIVLALYLLYPLFLYGQFSHDPGHFSRLSVTGNIEMTLQPGDDPRVEVLDPQISADDLQIVNTKGKLRIKVINNLFDSKPAIRILLTHAGLEAISAHAGAHVGSSELIEAERLQLRATSGANLTLRIEADRLDAGVFEGALLHLEGLARHQDTEATTGGKFEGFDLDCLTAEAKAHTGGHIRVFAVERLEAAAHTGGRIRYRGNPAQVERRSTFAGRITHAGGTQ